MYDAWSFTICHLLYDNIFVLTLFLSLQEKGERIVQKVLDCNWLNVYISIMHVKTLILFSYIVCMIYLNFFVQIFLSFFTGSRLLAPAPSKKSPATASRDHKFFYRLLLRLRLPWKRPGFRLLRAFFRVFNGSGSLSNGLASDPGSWELFFLFNLLAFAPVLASSKKARLSNILILQGSFSHLSNFLSHHRKIICINEYNF